MLQTLGEQSPISLLGKSQGGGVVLTAAKVASDRFDAIGLIAPVGLTAEFLGDTAAERRCSFLRRFIWDNTMTKAMNPFTDHSNIGAFAEISSSVVKDVIGRRLCAKLDFALGADLSSEIPALREAHPLKLFVGKEDAVFLPAEYQRVLGAIGCAGLIERIEGPHAPILNKTGAQQVKIAGRWLQSLH